MNTNVTAYQKAVATGMVAEYKEAVRGYYPRTNYSAIERAFAALPAEKQEAAKGYPDGRYVV